MQPTMKKTFYYNFLPSKSEEEICKAKNTPYKVTKSLVEIRDQQPPLVFDPLSRWQLKKALTHYEVATGAVVLSAAETFDYIFRNWSMEMAGDVVAGAKQSLAVRDVTDDDSPTVYMDSDVFFLDRGPDCEYFVLGCMELMRECCLKPGDVIGLHMHPMSPSFDFKVLRRALY